MKYEDELFIKELEAYLKEIGVIENKKAASFGGALLRQAKKKYAVKKVYIFLQENELLKDYKKHKNIILVNFYGVF